MPKTFDISLQGFQQLEAQLDTLKGDALDRAERKALRAAGDVIKPVLIANTPVRSDTPTGEQLAAGALKAAIRARTSISKNGTRSSKEIVDFGKLNYIAHFVDGGHANPSAKKGLKNTPAHPFVRVTQDTTFEPAARAYLDTMASEIDKVINDGK